VVRTTDELQVWAAAHGGAEVFRPGLIEDPSVAILMASDGDDVVAGVIGNRSGSVVGVSNLFVTAADPDEVWADAVDLIAARFPGLPLVGYETGAGLRAAHRAGFRSLGPLRVWLHEAGPRTRPHDAA
jgi:hypothetical protein